jgi:hypothetical protein
MVLFALLVGFAAQGQTKVENLIVVTIDGMRWQEVFTGMDPTIADNKRFNQGDSTYIYKKFGGQNASERKIKLLPFIWETVCSEGQLYGNRLYGNKVDTANPYWFSFPGYSELFTGFPDPRINSNKFGNNPHVTVLEFLNHLPKYKGKVAAFGAWEAFDRILNESRAGFPVISAFDKTGGKTPNRRELLFNKMLADSYKPWGDAECLDVFTHNAALEYLKTKHPKVLYIGYGETDEWAHAGQYRSYLDAAHQVDLWLKEIWDFVQKTPFYKNRTALIITVDHGRGDKNKNQWTDHGSSIAGANETWFAVIGPGISPKGEIKQDMQIYMEQLAQTMASLLGVNFTAEHPVAEEVKNIRWQKK